MLFSQNDFANVFDKNHEKHWIKLENWAYLFIHSTVNDMPYNANNLILIKSYSPPTFSFLY